MHTCSVSWTRIYRNVDSISPTSPLRSRPDQAWRGEIADDFPILFAVPALLGEQHRSIRRNVAVEIVASSDTTANRSDPSSSASRIPNAIATRSARLGRHRDVRACCRLKSKEQDQQFAVR